MKLIWVNHYAVTPDQAGGTRHAELGRELARRGWEVTVVATDFHWQLRQFQRRESARSRTPVEETVAGVRFLWLWSRSYQRNDWRRAANWLSFARGVVAVDGDAEIVVGSTPHLFAAAAAWLLARRRGGRFVLEVRDLWPESLIAAGGRRGPWYRLLEVLARFLYRRATRIIVLTPGVGAWLIERGVHPGAIVLAPNGVDPGGGASSSGRSPAGLTVGYVGSHGPANGLDVLVDAAGLLADDPSIRIVCVGDGPTKEALVAQARGANCTNIEFRPPVAKAAVPAVLAGFDAGLLLLRDAPLFRFGVSPNKLFDYLGAGLPVVSNVGGEVAALLADAGGGETVAGDCPDALAAAIRRLASLPAEERHARGAAGRAWVAANHQRGPVVEKLDAVFRQVVAEAR